MSDCCESSEVPELVGPTRTIFAFRLDRFEITVGRFRKFMAAYDAGYRPEPGSGRNPNDNQDRGWSWSLPDDLREGLVRSTDFSTWTDAPGDHENLPVNYLEWTSAFAFCIWDGGRLPTKEEWRYAATGGENRYYPWSVPATDRTIDALHASYGCTADGVEGCSLADMIVVGSKPAGNGRFGHSDLSGNVWEWVRDPTTGSGSSARGDACGGGFNDRADALTTNYCLSPPPDMMKGARCARAAN